MKNRLALLCCTLAVLTSHPPLAWATAQTAVDERNETAAEPEETSGETPEESAEPADSDTDTEDAEAAGEPERKVKEPVAEESSPDEPEPPKPFIAEERSLRITIEADGVFVAVDSVEVPLRPESWSDFKVLEAVEHGREVSEGEVLVRFDTADYEEAVEKKSIEDRLDELALREAEEELARQEEAVAIALETTQRRLDQLQDDFNRFKDVERPLTERIADYRLADARESLASQREELEQLEKMYEADDLTEETEAIVLRRQRFQVETAELVLESQQVNREYTLGVLLPRRQKQFETSLREAELDLQAVQAAQGTGLTRERFALEKARQQRARSVDEHAKLLADRGLLEIRSPADGVAYYGRCVDGKWTGVKSMRSKLRPHGKVAVGTVLMTIVKQRPFSVRVAAPEKHIAQLAPGQAVVIAPAADEALEIAGEVTEVAAAPVGGDFEVTITIDDETPDWLVAGMTCEADIVLYENESAVVIPEHLIVEGEGEERFVYVIDHGIDKPLRREVRTGRKKGKLVEVLRGLEAGDRVVPLPKKEPKKD
ncbi:MAG: HlyD family efflux transporter periplasmic adaptor subunit [Planctomycetota bacterium]